MFTNSSISLILCKLIDLLFFGENPDNIFVSKNNTDCIAFLDQQLIQFSKNSELKELEYNKNKDYYPVK